MTFMNKLLTYLGFCPRKESARLFRISNNTGNVKISRTLFIVILPIFLANALISTANVIEDGAVLQRVIPAVCWSIATIIWIVSYLRKVKGEKINFIHTHSRQCLRHCPVLRWRIAACVGAAHALGWWRR